MKENSLTLSVNVPETLTTRELADILGVETRTVQLSVQRLGLANELSQVKIRGQNAYVFNQEQATMIKQEIQKHSQLASRKIDNVTTEYEENQMIFNAMSILQRRSVELQKQLEEKQSQIDELTPDAESWRKFADSDGTFTASNVAKMLNISRDNELIPFLLLKKYIMRERHENPNRTGNLIGTALGIEKGYVKNYLYTNDKISRVQFKITPEGMQKIEKAFCHNELTPEQQKRVNAICLETEKTMKPTGLGLAE
jgi:phage antirepressor YoqD-like protein